VGWRKSTERLCGRVWEGERAREREGVDVKSTEGYVWKDAGRRRSTRARRCGCGMEKEHGREKNVCGGVGRRMFMDDDCRVVEKTLCVGVWVWVCPCGCAREGLF